MLEFSRLLFLCCALAVQILRIDALCYYPNGDLAATDLTCDSSKSTSHCCAAGYACLSNGLCMKTELTADRPGDTYGRGSCTSKSWGSDCPNYCVDPKIDIMDGGSGMGRCMEGSSINEFFCVNKEQGSVNCKSGKGVYTLGNPEVLTTIGVKGGSSTLGGLRVSTSFTTTLSSSTTTAASSLSTFTTSTNQDSKTTPDPNTDPTAAILTSPSQTSTISPSPPPPSSPAPSNSVAIGAGVGVGAGIVLLGIIAALLLYIRRRKKQQDPRGSLRCSHPPPFYQPAEMGHQRHFSVQKEREAPVAAAEGSGRTYELL